MYKWESGFIRQAYRFPVKQVLDLRLEAFDHTRLTYGQCKRNSSLRGLGEAHPRCGYSTIAFQAYEDVNVQM